MDGTETAFSFCKLTHLDDYIIEITPNDEVELGQQEMTALHQYIGSLSNRSGVLWLRQNHYSYTFDALTSIYNFDMIAATAVVLSQRADMVKTDYVKSVMNVTYPTRTFTQKGPAIEWLYQFA